MRSDMEFQSFICPGYTNKGQTEVSVQFDLDLPQP